MSGVRLVSVLFSEPKIPQLFLTLLPTLIELASFSALQRAENSSIVVRTPGLVGDFDVSVLFSEPKIPQYSRSTRAPFSVLVFQCSSASRKFLNNIAEA